MSYRGSAERRMPARTRTTLHRKFFGLLSLLPGPVRTCLVRTIFDGKYRGRTDPWGSCATSAVGRYLRGKHRRTLDCVPARDYRRILDVGCGDAAFTRLLAGGYPEAEIVATDISVDAVEQARRLGPRDERIRFLAVDVLGTDPGGRFDLIVGSELLYYLGRRGQRLSSERMRSLLLPGGLIVLVDPWPEARRLHHAFDADARLRRLHERVEHDERRPFAVTVYQRRGHDTSTDGAARSASASTRTRTGLNA